MKYSVEPVETQRSKYVTVNKLLKRSISKPVESHSPKVNFNVTNEQLQEPKLKTTSGETPA
ncbi:hypothetical protein CCR75_000424 [Bremia lactucae]|uniref:Uncharacterized protein n=1 Tax=Bremia lactucae TaxID=4779 RepID=A0A976FIG6_BRELC|nr:hypothetical protein CCR75_000424 [Bremia lactucae]